MLADAKVYCFLQKLNASNSAYFILQSPAVTQKIYSHTFENGFVLVAEPNNELESASFYFITPAGCCFDPKDRFGLASFTCEMVLRGCGDRDGRKFIQDLERLGVERNEGAGLSLTSYGGASVHHQLYPALEIYADLLRRPLLPEDLLEAGRQVCLLELASIEDDPGHKLMLELRRNHYPAPWGQNSYGTQESIKAITIDDIQSFHQQNYLPNGTILGVAGKFDWNQLVENVGRIFGDWESQEQTAPTETPKPEGIAHIEEPTNQTQIGIAYPTVPFKHKDYYQAWGANGVLSGGMSSRLFTEVREKRGLCYSVSASLNSQRERAAVLCHAGTSSERAQETLDVTVAEILRLHEGILPEELNRLKARIKSGLIMQQESSSARAGVIAREWYHLGRASTLSEIGKIIDALSAESINGYLEKNVPNQFTIVTIGPHPLEIPSAVS